MSWKGRETLFLDPIRPGNRGGAGHFSWDDVKGDKCRENYLGHSVKAPVGRWTKDKDPTWYLKTNGKHEDMQAMLRAERDKFKQQEEELRLEALGLKPKKKDRFKKKELDKTEKAELLQRGMTAAERTDYVDANEAKGLGFAKRPRTEAENDAMIKRSLEARLNATLNGKSGPDAPAQLPGQNSELSVDTSTNHYPPLPGIPTAAIKSEGANDSVSSDSDSSDSDSDATKEKKKLKKKLKKQKKKEKKAAKKLKKKQKKKEKRKLRKELKQKKTRSQRSEDDESRNRGRERDRSRSRTRGRDRSRSRDEPRSKRRRH